MYFGKLVFEPDEQEFSLRVKRFDNEKGGIPWTMTNVWFSFRFLCFVHLLYSWLRCTVVEGRSLTSELSLSHARSAAYG